MLDTKNTTQTLIDRIESGEALLPNNPDNVMEVVGILKSYAVVLDAYSRNLNFFAENQFLLVFPFFKYFDGEITFSKLLRHWWHDRLNFEYAEYCMRAMMWHGGGKLDEYVDSPEFMANSQAVIAAKFKHNIFVSATNSLFPDFLPEQLRVCAYYSGLGQFWRVMSDMFFSLSDLYEVGKVTSIAGVVDHIKNELVAAASQPITYAVKIDGQVYDIIPASAGLTFLADTALPYVEAIFFRGTPFHGTVSYNAKLYDIPPDQALFEYGALFADPLPIGGAGIPPTLLMQDMRHYLPDYLHEVYRRSRRGEDDLRVQICISFQKSMFCVTTATIFGLMPYPLNTTSADERKANRRHIKDWLDRLQNSCLAEVNS